MPTRGGDSRAQGLQPGNESDHLLVQEVKMFMKANKLSQVTVGQEARISQAVISQWLSLKYHGHNYKVRNALTSTFAQRAARAQACLPVPVTGKSPGNTGPPRERDRKVRPLPFRAACPRWTKP